MGATASVALLDLLRFAQTTTGGGGSAAEETDSVGGGLVILAVLLIFVLFFAAIIGLFVFIFRYVMRRNKERAAAMQRYAADRGLTYEGSGRLERATPLLKRGSGYSHGIVSGKLPGGATGKLANYQYTTGSGDDKRTYHFAVALIPMPELGSARFFLYRRVAGGLFDGIGDALTQYKTVELESEAFGSRFRLMVRDEANMIAIRQLFSPSFIVFLSEETPDDFWFEVEGGHLMGAVTGERWERPADLDWLAAATSKVAERIRADVAERMELRGATASPPPPPVRDVPASPETEPPPPPPPAR